MKEASIRDHKINTEDKQVATSSIKIKPETPRQRRHDLERRRHRRCLDKRSEDAKSSEKSVVLTLKVGLPKHAYFKETSNLDQYFVPPCESAHDRLVLTDSTTGQSTEEFKKYYDEMKRKKKELKPRRQKLYSNKYTDISRDRIETNDTNTFFYQDEIKVANCHPRRVNFNDEKYEGIDQKYSFGVSLNDSIIKQNPAFAANEEKLANILNKSRIQSAYLSSNSAVKDPDITKSFRNYQAVPERLLRNTAEREKYPNSCGICLTSNFGNESLEILNELRNIDTNNTPERDSMEILSELLNEPSNHNFGRSETEG